jgi:hypothetical protein
MEQNNLSLKRENIPLDSAVDYRVFTPSKIIRWVCPLLILVKANQKGIKWHPPLRLIKMGRRFLQILLMASLLSGAAAQTLACVAMMQSEGHACCRAINTKKASQKMRAAPAQQKEPIKSSNCCESNTSRSQQTPIDNRDSKQDQSALSNIDEVATISPVRKLSFTPARLRDPSGYSPPQFILHHSLLI